MKGMTMLKKLSLILAAVAVLAFAVPAFANATTGLTEAGVLVAPKQKVEIENIGTVTTTSPKLGSLECTFVTVTGEVATNTTSTVRVVGLASSNNKAEKCHKADGTPIT